MGLRHLAKKLSTPTEELDRQSLRAFCEDRGGNCTRIEHLVGRAEASVVGEIQTIRVVPRDGSPWLEAVVTDGSGSVVAMWTGRRSIPGIAPGRRLVVEGRFLPASPGASRLKIMNPGYELLGK